jgi:predicted ribosomally synthesized peptide with SipW-like signal peptide
MNKKILISSVIIGTVAICAIGVTVAYFSDIETSSGNTFAAGEIDLKVDLQCEDGLCGFPERDLPDEPAFFHECDVKPGDTGEVTISWHVYNNNAWGRIKLDKTYNWEYACNEPEALADITCGNPGMGEGELGKNLLFTLWLDQGTIAGWQCPVNTPHCTADPQEGDNILNGVETTLFEDVSADSFSQNWFVVPEELISSTTYYLGLQWELPGTVGNEAQGDSFTGKIVMQVVQSQNNPWSPTF